MIPLLRNNSLDTIPTLYEEFDVNFNLYISKEDQPNWRSVFRLTNTDNQQGNIGDRIALFEVYGDLSKASFYTDAGKPSKSVLYNSTLASQTWIPVHIQQAVVDGRFKIMFWLDNTSVGELLMDRPQPLSDTKIFAGDPFRIAMPGTIKNLNISTGKYTYS